MQSRAFLAGAHQLALKRLASAASPVMRLICQRDHTWSELELLRRELAILRSSSQAMLPYKRPDYQAEPRLAILQLKRHRWRSINKTAKQFVIHSNTLRSWIKAIGGRGISVVYPAATGLRRFDSRESLDTERDFQPPTGSGIASNTHFGADPVQCSGSILIDRRRCLTGSKYAFYAEIIGVYRR